MNDVQLLIEEIHKGREALSKIETFYERVAASVRDQGRSQEGAIVIGDLLSKYYTCLETQFLRISQFFENHLQDSRWHADLLDKMTLNLPGVRAAVITDETHSRLLELLKFRHFTRYYFDLFYDWDRIDYLMKKFGEVRSMLQTDMNQFLEFLQELSRR